MSISADENNRGEKTAAQKRDFEANPCGQPMRGIYGAESICGRPKGHTGQHDSIWNYKDWQAISVPTARIEVVRWLDSASINGGMWVSPDDIAPDAMSENGLTQATVGFVHDESDDVLLLVQSVGSDQLGAALAIPKRAIVERKEIGQVRP
jgi:hypothetical protein